MFLPKSQIGFALCPVCWGPKHSSSLTSEEAMASNAWPTKDEIDARFTIIESHGIKSIGMWAIGALQSPGPPNITELELAWAPWLPRLRQFVAGRSLLTD
jgi:hypothetical protein